MHRTLKAVEDADAARRDLHAEIDAVRIESFCLLQDAFPLIGREIALHQGNGAGSAAGARKRLDQGEFVRKLIAFSFQVEVVDDLRERRACGL